MLTERKKSRCSVIFTGHMIDLETRQEPRFPAKLEHIAGAAILLALRRLREESEGDLVGLSSAARGGDLLFLEACQRLMIEAFVVIPFSREKFAETSVVGVASGCWLERYNKMLDHLGPSQVEVMSETPSPQAFDKCNLRLLEAASSMCQQVVLLALVDSDSVQESGGTAHFVAKVRDTGGQVEIIELNKLRTSY